MPRNESTYTNTAKGSLSCAFSILTVLVAQLESLTGDISLCIAPSLMPGVIKGHFGDVDVHFHGTVRWSVPPVRDGLLVGCWDV